MIFYCDSSALLKQYLEEEGSDEFMRLISESEYVTTSAITELEMTSAIERSKRNRLIDSPHYRHIYEEINRDLKKGFITLIAISPTILEMANAFIKQRRLRPADAIQLATAKTIAEQSEDHSLEFICSDHALLEAARLEGLRCANPVC